MKSFVTGHCIMAVVAATLLSVATTAADSGPLLRGSHMHHGDHPTSSSSSATMLVEPMSTNSALAMLPTTPHRHLQLLPLVCTLVSGLLPGDVACECAIVLGVQFQCGFGNPICVGGQDGFCAKPLVSGEISLAPLKVGFQFCAAEATNGGQATSSLCINFGGELEDELLTPSAPKAAPKTDGDGNVFANSATTSSGPTAKINFCEAVVNEQDCSSCEICDNGHGYVFDCSNVDATMVQSTCTPFSVIASLRPNQEKISFMPHLDSMST
jgi:hypothetical protein